MSAAEPSLSQDALRIPPSVFASSPPREDEATTCPTLVLIHGLFGSPLEFSFVTRWLRLRDVPFELLEIPGYTGRGATRSSWRHWVEAARKAIEERFAPDEAIVVGGLGVGGVIAAALTEMPCRQAILGLAMLSPTWGRSGWALARWRHLRDVSRRFGLDRWAPTRDHEFHGMESAAPRRPAQRIGEIRRSASVGSPSPPRWAVREANRLSIHVRRGLAELDVPVLVAHAADDAIVSLSCVPQWLISVAAPSRLTALDDRLQFVAMDGDRGGIARHLAEFVGSRVARGRATC